MIKSFINGLLGGGIGAIDGLLGRFLVNKDAVEGNLHSEQMAAMSALAAEFGVRTNRTWWDSFVDGLNRLPRPVLAFGALGMLAWAPYDPVGFAAAMHAYAVMPEWLALVIAQIILLFAGGRMLEKWSGRMAGPSPETVAGALASIERIKAMKAAPSAVAEQVPPYAGGLHPDSDAPPMDAEDYREQMEDTAKPMSNHAIKEWNQRRQSGQAAK